MNQTNCFVDQAPLAPLAPNTHYTQHPLIPVYSPVYRYARYMPGICLG